MQSILWLVAASSASANEEALNLLQGRVGRNAGEQKPEQVARAARIGCDPSVDKLCIYRHTSDNNTCGADGCGNRAEFRKKIAMMKPVHPPSNAERDAIAAALGRDLDKSKNEQLHNLHFQSITENDLGGGGIRFSACTTLQVNGAERPIDCLLTAKGYKAHDASKNGLKGALATVNIAHSTTVDFTMTFLDQATKQPAVLGPFYFSVFDIDTGNDTRKKAQEVLTIGGYKEYLVTPKEKGGELEVTEMGNVTTFAGTVHGVEADNPYDPFELTDQQVQRTVDFKFAPGLSHFQFQYSVGEATGKGRNVLFAGMTEAYFCKAPKVDLDFSLAKVSRSNLGNKGPHKNAKEGILYSNIARIGGQTLDLEINALSKYVPMNTKRNGLNGKFGQINLGTPDRRSGAPGVCKFSFSLKKGGTDEPYKADWLYFSMFDLDNAKKNKKWNPKWQESLTVDGFSSQFLSKDSEILVEQLDNTTFRYNSSKVGTGKDNPRDPLKLNAKMKRRTVTFVYRGVSTFNATFAISEPNYRDGRNFLFAGKSSTSPCDQNTEGDVVNLHGPVLPR